MSKRARLATAVAGALLVCSLIAASSPREPRYQALTMGQWLKRRDDAQAHQALLILGTNNLPLLVRRIQYDGEKDILCRAFNKLPYRLKITACARWVENLRARRTHRSWEATQVLFTIGTNAAAEIPKLAAIAENGGSPAYNALDVLERLGAEGLAVVASTTHATNAVLRQYAVAMLITHPESTVACAAVTNALTDPNPNIRHLAQFYITNRTRYIPSPGPAPGGFE